MFYNARWYDPSLGRFAQADTIVPGGVQGLDRYAYVQNNPLRYIDPTGHRNCEEDGYNCPDDLTIDDLLRSYNNDNVKDKCPAPFQCGGDNESGYIYDPVTHKVAVWGEGVDGANIYDYDDKDNDGLHKNLDKFTDAIDNRDDAESAFYLDFGEFILSTAAFAITGIAAATPLAPFAIAGLTVEGLAILWAGGNMISDVRDYRDANNSAIEIWNTLPNP